METYGQTRSLSNLQMKHVDKLASIAALLKAFETSCVRTMQSRTYLSVGFFVGFSCIHVTNLVG